MRIDGPCSPMLLCQPAPPLPVTYPLAAGAAARCPPPSLPAGMLEAWLSAHVSTYGRLAAYRILPPQVRGRGPAVGLFAILVICTRAKAARTCMLCPVSAAPGSPAPTCCSCPKGDICRCCNRHAVPATHLTSLSLLRLIPRPPPPPPLDPLQSAAAVTFESREAAAAAAAGLRGRGRLLVAPLHVLPLRAFPEDGAIAAQAQQVRACGLGGWVAAVAGARARVCVGLGRGTPRRVGCVAASA